MSDLISRDAAIAAVPSGWNGQPHQSNMDYGPNVSAKAVAAIRILPAVQPQVVVKPLEWLEAADSWRSDVYSISTIRREGWPESFFLSRGTRIIRWDDAIEPLKAAAQADYDASTRAVLVLVPQLDPDMPADEIRLHMGELTAQEVRAARAAIRWANAVRNLE